MLVRVIRVPGLPGGASAIFDVQAGGTPVLWLQEGVPPDSARALQSELEALLGDEPPHQPRT